MLTQGEIRIQLLLVFIETTMFASAYLSGTPFGYNPILAVGYIILTGINAGFIFMMVGADPLGVLVILIFAGGFGVIIMFIVKMLEIKAPYSERFQTLSVELYFIVIFGFLFPILLLFGYAMNDASAVLDFYVYSEKSFLKNGIILEDGYLYDPVKLAQELRTNFGYYSFINSPSSLESIGLVLYTKYFVVFLLSGIILLLAMIGSIFITLNYDAYNKKQHIFQQVSRNAANAVFKIS